MELPAEPEFLMSHSVSKVGLSVLVLFSSGCSTISSYSNPHTVPRSRIEPVIQPSIQYANGTEPGTMPGLDVGFRVGLQDHVDAGFRVGTSGAYWDVKKELFEDYKTVVSVNGFASLSPSLRNYNLEWITQVGGAAPMAFVVSKELELLVSPAIAFQWQHYWDEDRALAEGRPFSWYPWLTLVPSVGVGTIWTPLERFYVVPELRVGYAATLDRFTPTASVDVQSGLQVTFNIGVAYDGKWHNPWLGDGNPFNY
jgi:hypothetical protein